MCVCMHVHMIKSVTTHSNYAFICVHNLHPGCQPDLTMMYAGTKQAVVKFAEVTKVCLQQSLCPFLCECALLDLPQTTVFLYSYPHINGLTLLLLLLWTASDEMHAQEVCCCFP